MNVMPATYWIRMGTFCSKIFIYDIYWHGSLCSTYFIAKYMRCLEFQNKLQISKSSSNCSIYSLVICGCQKYYHNRERELLFGPPGDNSVWLEQLTAWFVCLSACQFSLLYYGGHRSRKWRIGVDLYFPLILICQKSGRLHHNPSYHMVLITLFLSSFSMSK